jgi:ribosomal protein S27E
MPSRFVTATPLRCPTCGRRGRVTQPAGCVVRCPVCDERLVVPLPPSAEATASVPAVSGERAMTDTVFPLPAATDTGVAEGPLDCRD